MVRIVLACILLLCVAGATCRDKTDAKTTPDPTEVGIGMDMTLN